MNNKYDHKQIEKKWQEYWDKEKLYRTSENQSKPKYYILDMFPYPSGAGLHVGHPKGYIATDIFARQKIMQGFNVLHPMGWDAFGLPAENYALQMKIHPRISTEHNIQTFKKQLSLLGFTYDWDREINTTDPEFYKWTQWAFIKMFENDLAYESFEPINWCPSCQTGLANEDLENGRCERCGSEIERRPMRQWVLKITAYAERMLNDLEKLPLWEESIKEMQKNWIGRSEGAAIKFPISNFQFPNDAQNSNGQKFIEVFTTRPDTLFGATFMVISPEHQLIQGMKNEINNWNEVENYLKQAQRKSDLERTDLNKEKSGIKIDGVTAINPVNNQEIPIFAADYVLTGYGTGAIMAVPAHDERDWEFAKKYDLPVIQVVSKENFIPRSYLMGGTDIEDQELTKIGVKILEKTDIGNRKLEIPHESMAEYIKIIKDKMTAGFWNEIVDKKILFIFKDKNGTIKEFFLDKTNAAEIEKLAAAFSNRKYLGKTSVWRWLAENDLYTNLIIHSEDGRCVNSESLDGLTTEDAKKKIISWLEEKGLGRRAIHYKIKDWVFSRQRYWGEPIPIIHCEHCGNVAVQEEQLPVLLPEVEHYEPTGTGESPLANITDWVNTTCPKCGKPAKRETNTMPQWAGSSWYFLRFIDPHNDKALADKAKDKYWSPVDFYVGGAEHATRHLIYARFWHKFLFDVGAVNYDEPFTRLQHVGLILAEDGRKMSKRWNNVINPDEVVEKYGADAMRVYEMFMGPFSQPCAWSTNGLIGTRKFLDKVWKLYHEAELTDCGGGDQRPCLNTPSGITRLLHQTIKKVTEDIEGFHFNTAIAQMMIFVNFAVKHQAMPKAAAEKFLIILAPFAPHLAEELWRKFGNQESIFKQPWPEYNPALIKDEMINLVIQVDGKLRDAREAPNGITEEQAKELALTSEKVQKWLKGKKIVTVIFVKGKLVNIVTK